MRLLMHLLMLLLMHLHVFGAVAFPSLSSVKNAKLTCT